MGAARYDWPFSLARDFAAKDLAHRGQSRVIMPWVERDVDRVRAIMGDNYWSYGVNENIKSIEAMLRYFWQQGLLPRQLTRGDLRAIHHRGFAIVGPAPPSKRLMS